ncbi:MAG: hypothetical protein ACLT98_14570 [Eggerthellaceae bacterium]
MGIEQPTSGSIVSAKTSHASITERAKLESGMAFSSPLASRA